MKAFVDADICIGCALCTQTCPPAFRMNDDKAVVYTDQVSEADEACCKQAAEECPVDAIRIE